MKNNGLARNLYGFGIAWFAGGIASIPADDWLVTTVGIVLGGTQIFIASVMWRD